ncbi:MAG: RluA family pseudouridine synthase [Candidatus Gracilibacteria bacterium]|nr:RluA family pseudouridine synthase [Candidatus Gracilibacteria bacterium]
MIYKFCVYLKEKQRVDMYLSTLFSDFSRSYIQKIIDNSEVKVNGKIINKNLKVQNKDLIEISINIQKLELKAENMSLDIIYEDENLAIINKDAGINTHPVPGENGKTGTLVNALLYQIKDLSSIGGMQRPGIVHRLDKDTSGVIMIAKNDKMMAYLQDIIKKREKIGKYYLAIISGIIKDKEFKIESFIGRHPNDKIKMTIKNPINPKIAISYVKVIDYIDEKFTLVEVKIETGRTHQIRVHLSSIGFPIIGDKVYGNKKVNEETFLKYGLSRQALHSYRLEIELYGEMKTFIGKLKNDMKKIIGAKIKNNL